MDKILLVTNNKPGMSDLADALLNDSRVELVWAAGGEEALAAQATEKPDLVVADEQLGDMSGLELVGRLVRVNPFVNTAVVSGLSEADFHEASEGLGVLMPLSSQAPQDMAAELIDKLRKMKEMNAAFTPVQ